MNIIALAIIKRSAQYRGIRSRVAKACPSDSWYEGEMAFVVFDLEPAAHEVLCPTLGAAQAVFALRISSGDLLAARIIEGTGEETRLVDLPVRGTTGSPDRNL